MAWSRLLKHEFFMNYELAQKSPHARLLFTGLWLLVDREGRMKDEPAKIWAKLFPYEKLDIERLLEELNPEFIIRYELAGETYLEVINFKKHQRIHPKEKSYGIPPPPSRNGKIRGIPRNSAKFRVPLPLPLPLPLRKVPKESGHSRGLDIEKAKREDELEGWFNIAFGRYPKKEKREAARKKWMKLNPDKILFGKILLAIKSQTPELSSREPKYIPLFRTWIDGKEWENDTQLQKQDDPEYGSYEYLQKNKKDITPEMYAERGL